jgi:hypothetical protein
MLGINDVVDPAVAAPQPSGTLLNESFESFSKRTGIEARDLWRAGDAQTAATAKLFILAHLCGTVREPEKTPTESHMDSPSTRASVTMSRKSQPCRHTL